MGRWSQGRLPERGGPRPRRWPVRRMMSSIPVFDSRLCGTLMNTNSAGLPSVRLSDTPSCTGSSCRSGRHASPCSPSRIRSGLLVKRMSSRFRVASSNSHRRAVKNSIIAPDAERAAVPRQHLPLVRVWGWDIFTFMIASTRGHDSSDPGPCPSHAKQL